MPKIKPKQYRVSIAWKSVKYFEVKATSQAEAEAKAEARCAKGDAGDDYWESSESVEEVALIKE